MTLIRDDRVDPMNNLMIRSDPFVNIDLIEGTTYTDRALCVMMQQKLTMIDDEFILDCIHSDLTDYLCQDSINRYRFDKIGLVIPRKINEIFNRGTKDVILLIFPKWKAVSQAEIYSSKATMGLIMKSIFRYLRSSTRKRIESQLSTRSDINHQVPQSLSLDSIRILIQDVQRYGIIREIIPSQGKRKGRPNWKKTFRKTMPIIHRNTPYFLEPIRDSNIKLRTQLSVIQQECYDYSMTCFSMFFSIPNALPFRERRYFSETETRSKLSIIELALSRTRVQKERIRILIIKQFLQNRLNGNQNQSHVFAVNSSVFDYVWEDMLLRTIGDHVLTEEINGAFSENRTVITPISRRGSELGAHRIDGSILCNNEMILFDAKNRRSWKNLPIEDITKQYAYEAGINRFVERGIISNGQYVRLNILIYPENPAYHTDEPTLFTLTGDYKLDYLQQFSQNDSGLMVVHANPFVVMRRYVEHSNELQELFGDFIQEVP
jgi:hypothetical protein